MEVHGELWKWSWYQELEGLTLWEDSDMAAKNKIKELDGPG